MAVKDSLRPVSFLHSPSPHTYEVVIITDTRTWIQFLNSFKSDTGLEKRHHSSAITSSKYVKECHDDIDFSGYSRVKFTWSVTKLSHKTCQFWHIMQWHNLIHCCSASNNDFTSYKFYNRVTYDKHNKMPVIRT